jgi:hypothetical protein
MENTMLKRLLLLSLLLLTLVATSVFAQTAEPEIPPQVQRALEHLAELREVQELTLNDIESYEFTQEFGDINDTCRGSRTRAQTYYRVAIFIKEPDGSVSRYDIHVPTINDDVFTCGVNALTVTPTPTVNLTQTTATPTFTPSNTFTPSHTPTNTLTPTITNTYTATSTFTPTITFTPSVTPRPSSVTCEGFLTSRLRIGEQGRVIDGPIRLRSRASASGNQVALMDEGATFGVMQGPECDPSGRAWWRVSYSRFNGWVIEGEGENYYTEPILGSTFASATPLPPTRTPVPTVEGTPVVITCSGFLPSRLVIGEQGRVTPGDPNNVREFPSASGTLVGQIPGEGVFDVLEGPECDPAGRAWWKVNYEGIEGWTVEGQGDQYYVEPVTP